MSEQASHEMMWPLFDAACDGQLDESGVARLQQLLLDPQILEKYLLYHQLHTDMQFRVRFEMAGRRAIAQGMDDENGGLLNEQSLAAGHGPILPVYDRIDGGAPFDRLPSDGTWMAWIGGWCSGGSIPMMTAVGFAVALIAGLAVFWHELSGTGSPRGGGKIPLAAPSGVEASFQESATFVARITRASRDFAWASDSGTTDFLLRIPADRRLKIASGQLELEFRAGAKLVVYGPAVFEATGPAAGRLLSGAIQCETNLGAFRLQTPPARLEEADGEFVASVLPESGVQVAVVTGRLKVNTGSNSHGLKSGLAASVSMEGVVELELAADMRALHARCTTPAWPRAASAGLASVCLIDAIAGGNGFETHLAGAVDPSSGSRDFFGAGRELKLSDRAYHEVGCSSLVDGVFVPAESGRSVQIDSTGTMIDLPAGHGHCWGSLWACHREALRVHGDLPAALDANSQRTHAEIVSKLKVAMRGVIGMRANLGITIDLRTVQAGAMRSAKQFRSRIASIENPMEVGLHSQTVSRRTMDLRIYVDGRLRGERLRFSKVDGDVPIVAPLTSGDRFLTIVAMENGGMRFDQVVLVDPALDLEAPSEQVAVSR